MKVQKFTHCLSERNVRRFFVSYYQNELYKKIESEIHMIINNKYSDLSIRNLELEDLYMYVRLRIDSVLFWPEVLEQEFNRITLRDHLLDFCDVIYTRRVRKLPGGISYRMYRYSEPLAINRRK